MPQLPTLKQVWFKALLSVFKNKNRFKRAYNASKTFVEPLNTAKLSAFCGYFGYKNPAPLPYFYVQAQQAHLALMLDKGFPVPVVGLVHLENELTLISPPDLALPFDIKALVSADANEGSIPFKFEVTFYQNGKEVISCTSLYLCKRTNKSATKTKKAATAPVLDGLPNITPIAIAASKGNSYAKLSGDYNPIHTSTLLAKLFGFKKKIIHGWYTLSYCVAQLENTHSINAVKVGVKFRNPVFLPGKVVMHSSSPLPMQNTGKSMLIFSVTNADKSQLHAEGAIAF